MWTSSISTFLRCSSRIFFLSKFLSCSFLIFLMILFFSRTYIWRNIYKLVEFFVFIVCEIGKIILVFGVILIISEGVDSLLYGLVLVVILWLVHIFELRLSYIFMYNGIYPNILLTILIIGNEKNMIFHQVYSLSISCRFKFKLCIIHIFLKIAIPFFISSCLNLCSYFSSFLANSKIGTHKIFLTQNRKRICYRSLWKNIHYYLF